MTENPESEITKTVTAGNLVSDEMIAELTADFFAKNEGKNILIDGAIRTLAQKSNFDKITKDYQVIYLDLSEQEAVERLGGRRIDPETKEVFGADFAGDVNPATGNTLITRKDDTPEAIATRIEAFKSQTLPLIDAFMQDSDITCTTIDASASRDDIWTEIQSLLD